MSRILVAALLFTTTRAAGEEVARDGPAQTIQRLVDADSRRDPAPPADRF
jgi:hypothetical protein